MERELAIETGRWIFSAWKHVRRYDANAQSRMGATAHAGKAGDLLGRLRMLERYGLRSRDLRFRPAQPGDPRPSDGAENGTS
jgi:hypothetical protein